MVRGQARFFPSVLLTRAVTRTLKTSLQMLESKFCYMRWEGLVQLLELVETAVKDTQKIGSYLGHLMARNKMQQRIFGLIIDGSHGQITPVTSKETSIALEILQKAQKIYVVNPHAKGFSVLIRLVVETALPQVQIPALRFIFSLIQSPFCMKSFRKSGGVETLGKWVKEQRVAARVISTRPTLDVLESGSKILMFLSENEGDRARLEAVFGAKEFAEITTT